MPKGVPQKPGTFSTEDVERVLRKLGYRPKPHSQRGRGSHLVWVKEGCHPVPVLQGQKDFAPKTLRTMVHQMGITFEEFLALLND